MQLSVVTVYFKIQETPGDSWIQMFEEGECGSPWFPSSFDLEFGVSDFTKQACSLVTLGSFHYTLHEGRCFSLETPPSPTPPHTPLLPVKLTSWQNAKSLGSD